jgi:hypothetical protein
MFQADRWAAAFTELCGEDIDEGVEAINTFVSCTAQIRSRFGGSANASRFEALLRKALAETGFDSGLLTGRMDVAGPSRPANRGTELALRFIVFLVKKDHFKYRLALLEEIEKASDRMKGVLRITLESVAPVDKKLEEKIKAELIRRTGAREVVLGKRIVRELIAGYRLYIGTELVDTSLQGLMRKMAVDLGVPISRNTDNDNDDDLIDSVWESV